ncbi:acetate/propionate family kinase [Iocasia frigidifontis]|uniref:Acetate kinase n=1 Tax=Iocasia fonsfrigidae TaxID=2682810 RepID=A0A8A7KAE1_9FIRM|nr:acetate kinase [Iocasia fonsfrigidae]QTL98210.1 acetate/propionate family kinase [Iocasia fonsfrigidae]
MKILVLNSGSSSVKYQLIDMDNESVLAKGVVERIGITDSVLEHEPADREAIVIKEDIPDHAAAIKMVIEALLNEEHGVLNDIDEINAVGHRVVHGGEKFASSILIDKEVIKEIEDVSDLAPLHNPHNLTGIRVCNDLLEDKPQVAVFDTAFHQTMPNRAFMYALPYEYYERYGIRRYGFHGTSHKYVAQRTSALMDRPLEDLKIITCHLGNGASITAIDGGKSIDTSMGLTPLEGLMMGTRCGDIDPAIIPFVMEKEGLTMAEMDSIMNKKSGLLGVSGISSDSRDVEAAAGEDNKRAEIALEMFDYRVAKYVGAYVAAMGGVDAIVFTAGIGENQKRTRADVINNLKFLNIKLNKEANNSRGKEILISTEDSSVKVFVIPTNEELMIARDTQEIVSAL